MEQLFIKVASEVPALAVLVFVVYLFLKHLRGQNDFIAELHREHMEARGHSRAIIEQDIQASTANTVALNEVARALRELPCHPYGPNEPNPDQKP